MIKILKHGLKAKKPKKFVRGKFACIYCGCEFEADADDVAETNFYSYECVVMTEYSAVCPECGSPAIPYKARFSS